MNGIPARFVSGYIARPSEFEETEDGMYLAELDDSTAHAWAEVYVEGCGWLPAEMTPAYRQNSAGGTSEPDGPVSVVGRRIRRQKNRRHRSRILRLSRNHSRIRRQMYRTGQDSHQKIKTEMERERRCFPEESG